MPQCPHLKDRALPHHARGLRHRRLPGPLPSSGVHVCLTCCWKAARLQPANGNCPA